MPRVLMCHSLGTSVLCPLVQQRLRVARRVCPCAPARSAVVARAEQRRGGVGLGDENIDVAVFRFTLGIPGFEDRLIPRVVGGVIGSLLVLNHVLGAQPTPDAQLRSEWLGALLAVLCLFVPDIEERLREVMPGRGRQKAAEAIEGATNCFLLDPSLPEAAKKELAWASFSLLKNTNCCAVVAVVDGQALMARGAVGSGVVKPGDAAASLAAISADLAANCDPASQLGAVAGGAAAALWLPSRGGLGGAGAGALACLPAGAQCLAAARLGAASGRRGALLVWSERPRALSDRERGWVAALADKVAAFV